MLDNREFIAVTTTLIFEDNPSQHRFSIGCHRAAVLNSLFCATLTLTLGSKHYYRLQLTSEQTESQRRWGIFKVLRFTDSHAHTHPTLIIPVGDGITS